VDACGEKEMEGRKARCLATVKKSVSPVQFPLEKGKFLVHIEQAEPLKQFTPDVAVPGALSVLRQMRGYFRGDMEEAGLSRIHCIGKICDKKLPGYDCGIGNDGVGLGMVFRRGV